MPEVPDTEATRLLKTINVHPEQLIELAEMPARVVELAIADGTTREGVRDPAGWVVKLLHAHRNYGWTIRPPRPHPNSPEALAAAFARYAAEEEAIRRAGMHEDAAWFPPPEPEPQHVSGAPLRLWNQVQAALKTQISSAEFNSWIRRVLLTSLEPGMATLMAPNALIKQAIENRYLGMLRDLLAMFAGEAVDVRVVLNPSALAERTPAENAPAAPPLVAPDGPMPAGASPDGASPETATPPSAESCPDWIAAARWPELPIMLRAALRGSRIEDGLLRACSPHLNRLLRTRYAAQVEALLAAREAVSQVEEAPRESASS